MRILVAGHSGQLAQALTAAGGDRHVIIAIGRPDLDLSRPSTISSAVASVRPDAIINTGAYTAVDNAEGEEALATAVSTGAGHLAAEAAQRSLPFIHVSTDYVFDGRSTRPYREEDAVCPLGAYGRSKLAGERAVQEAMPAALIVRTAWVFSHEGTNFVRTMLRLGATRDTINVVSDQKGSPTYAVDLANALLALMEKSTVPDGPSQGGVFHAAGTGITTWYGFASRIFAGAAARGLQVPEVRAILSSEYPTPARRPMFSALDCSKLRDKFSIKLPAWDEALERCLDRLLGPTGGKRTQ